jgi:hypothetical protein
VSTESFTCPRCARTSHQPEDIKYGYCGACHDWTGDQVLAELRKVAAAAACPLCGLTGCISIAWRLVAKPLGSFSLSGSQMKLSANRSLWATCSTPGCGMEARVNATPPPEPPPPPPFVFRAEDGREWRSDHE